MRQQGISLREIAIITASVLIALIIVLELTLVYPAMPPIAEAFHTRDAGWVITITMLVGVFTTPITGKLADLYGKKRVILITAVLFLAGSLLCAITTTMPILFVGRALQGASLSITVLLYAVLRESLPQRLAPIGIGCLSIMLGVAVIAGPFLSGVLLDNFGFRSVFWFCAIYILVAIAFFAAAVPNSGFRARRRLDPVGALLLGAGIGLVFLTIEQGGSWGWVAAPTITALVCGILVLLLFVLRSLRTTEPLIDLRILTRPGMRTPLIIGVVGYFAANTFSVVIPLMLETPAAEGAGYGFGVTALGLAVFYLPYGLTGVAFGPLCGLLIQRGHTSTLLRICTAALTIGMACLGLLHAHAWQVLLGAAITGIGFALLAPLTGYLTVDRAPEDQRAIATGVLGVAEQIGGGLVTPVALAVLGANLSHLTSAGTAVYTDTGYQLTFLIAAAVSLIGVAVTLTGRVGGNVSQRTSEETRDVAVS
ncbi:MAG TPA: MFS transporter [Amycolatopsis sp.]|nr:MFS transporter [Amycolatopsis sp.]